MNVLAAAAELLESNSSFALRIQTSEPVLVSIAKALLPIFRCPGSPGFP